MVELPFLKKKKDLIARCQAWHPSLYRIARAWGCEPDLAHELAQETLLRALQNLGQLRDANALQSWLISILANNFRAHLRRSQKLTSFDAEELIYASEPVNELERQRTIQKVRQALSRLSDDHRQVITLVDMEGLSYAEVASALDIRIGTVMSRLSRARARLRELLEDLLRDESESENAPARHLREVK